VCGTIDSHERSGTEGGLVTAEDWQAVAEWVAAAAVLYAVIAWAWRRRPRGAGERIRAFLFPPRVSLAAGVKAARRAARSGHPPYTPTEGAVSPDQPLGYLLAKVAETVWSAASDSDPSLVPVRNYLEALAYKAGTSAARDFALGVLTERVRQEENGWPDQPGDPGGKRGPHGSGNSHRCLLQRKREVEDAIYSVEA
jgi:hypothetical protein